jgi:hypothetical protein
MKGGWQNYVDLGEISSTERFKLSEKSLLIWPLYPTKLLRSYRWKVLIDMSLRYFQEKKEIARGQCRQHHISPYPKL